MQKKYFGRCLRNQGFACAIPKRLLLFASNILTPVPSKIWSLGSPDGPPFCTWKSRSCFCKWSKTGMPSRSSCLREPLSADSDALRPHGCMPLCLLVFETPTTSLLVAANPSHSHLKHTETNTKRFTGTSLSPIAASADTHRRTAAGLAHENAELLDQCMPSDLFRQSFGV